jgi:hypothetical protein
MTIDIEKHVLPVHDPSDRGRNPVLRDELAIRDALASISSWYGTKRPSNRPENRRTPAGPWGSVLPVHDPSDRGGTAIIRDELAVVVSLSTYLEGIRAYTPGSPMYWITQRPSRLRQTTKIGLSLEASGGTNLFSSTCFQARPWLRSAK